MPAWFGPFGSNSDVRWKIPCNVEAQDAEGDNVISPQIPKEVIYVISEREVLPNGADMFSM